MSSSATPTGFWNTPRDTESMDPPRAWFNFSPSPNTQPCIKILNSHSTSILPFHFLRGRKSAPEIWLQDFIFMFASQFCTIKHRRGDKSPAGFSRRGGNSTAVFINNTNSAREILWHLHLIYIIYIKIKLQGNIQFLHAKPSLPFPPWMRFSFCFSVDFIQYLAFLDTDIIKSNNDLIFFRAPQSTKAILLFWRRFESIFIEGR